jgi:GNAT superfamily N-acetyltransferase
MRSRYQVVPFTADHLKPAVGLFVRNYRHEQGESALLPSRTIDNTERICDSIRPLLKNPGVVVLQDGEVIAFMLSGYRFRFKGQEAMLVPEYCHASILSDKNELNQIMYMRLAEEWVRNHMHLHIIGHFAHDTVLRESLYQLGFGAIIAEALRDLSGIPGAQVTGIVQETDVERLVDINAEDDRYYRDSPIFLVKEVNTDKSRAAPESSIRRGDAYFVFYENGEAQGYLAVGESVSGAREEGFLLRGTCTSEIKRAFVRPHLRGTGIGKALLQRAVDWSAAHGYERLFVEYETANYFGGNFWRRHFAPYVYFSMRYVDNTI